MCTLNKVYVLSTDQKLRSKSGLRFTSDLYVFIVESLLQLTVVVPHVILGSIHLYNVPVDISRGFSSLALILWYNVMYLDSTRYFAHFDGLHTCSSAS